MSGKDLQNPKDWQKLRKHEQTKSARDARVFSMSQHWWL